jgi:hypothetical protein
MEESRMSAAAVRIAVPRSAIADFEADYADCFQVESVPGKTAAQWAQASLRGADGPFSRVVWQGVLGFALTSGAPDTLVGWPIVQDDPERFVLQTGGRLMAGRMVFEVDAAVVRWTTSLDFHGPIGRAVWAGAGPAHRRIAPRSLEKGRRALLRVSRPSGTSGGSSAG